MSAYLDNPLKQRMKVFLLNEERLPAHKFVLSVASEVLHGHYDVPEINDVDDTIFTHLGSSCSYTVFSCRDQLKLGKLGILELIRFRTLRVDSSTPPKQQCPEKAADKPGHVDPGYNVVWEDYHRSLACTSRHIAQLMRKKRQVGGGNPAAAQRQTSV